MLSNAVLSESPSLLLDASLRAELKRIELRSRRTVSADMLGQYRSAFRGSGLTFTDIRQYQPGDDTRNIHWKATARTGTVFVKDYEEDRQLRVLLLIDISRSTICGRNRSKHTRALEFAAIISSLARSARDAIGICLFADQVYSLVPPKRSRHQFDRVLLELMAQKDLPPGTDLRLALQEVLRHQRRPALMFLVSDFLCEPFFEELRPLAARHDVVCVHLEDPLDFELPKVGLLETKGSEDGRRLLVDTYSRRGRRSLLKRYRERSQRLAEQVKSAGADLITVDADPLQPLIQLMHRRTRQFR